jgi:hypothetical protein
LINSTTPPWKIITSAKVFKFILFKDGSKVFKDNSEVFEDNSKVFEDGSEVPQGIRRCSKVFEDGSEVLRGIVFDWVPRVNAKDNEGIVMPRFNGMNGLVMQA